LETSCFILNKTLASLSITRRFVDVEMTWLVTEFMFTIVVLVNVSLVLKDVLVNLVFYTLLSTLLINGLPLLISITYGYQNICYKTTGIMVKLFLVLIILTINKILNA